MSQISRISDIVELRTWANDASYSISALKEDLEAILPEEEVENAERFSIEAFEEFETRQRLLLGSYPFDVDGSTIIPNARKDNSSYLFCLGLSHFRSIPNVLRDREFELLVESAAGIYFRGTTVRIGAPWKTAEIQNYRDLLQRVSDMIPDAGPPILTAAPYGGDRGWDVVVVNNFSDAAFSRIIALGNCATGRTDWHTKGSGEEMTFFWDGFTHHPDRKNACLWFLAVPFQLTEHQKHRKQGHRNVLFDRIRICSLEGITTQDVMDWLATKIDEALDLSLI